MPSKKANKRPPQLGKFPGYPGVQYILEPKLGEGGYYDVGFSEDYPKVVIGREDPHTIAHEFAHYEQSKPYALFPSQLEVDQPGGVTAWWEFLRGGRQQAAQNLSDPQLLKAALELLHRKFGTRSGPTRLRAEPTEGYIEGFPKSAVLWAATPYEQQAERAAAYFRQYQKRAKHGPVHMPLVQILDAWKAGEGLPSTYARKAREGKPPVKKHTRGR